MEIKKQKFRMKLEISTLEGKVTNNKWCGMEVF
jgi:hypothetical protein